MFWPHGNPFLMRLGKAMVRISVFGKVLAKATDLTPLAPRQRGEGQGEGFPKSASTEATHRGAQTQFPVRRADRNAVPLVRPRLIPLQF
jgi:hypothetical protein